MASEYSDAELWERADKGLMKVSGAGGLPLTLSSLAAEDALSSLTDGEYLIIEKQIFSLKRINGVGDAIALEILARLGAYLNKETERANGK